MKKILEIQSKIRRLYEWQSKSVIENPLHLQAEMFKGFAKDYLEAAKFLDDALSALWLQRLQLTGHGIELALKMCLLISGDPPPNTHDLVKLYCLVSEKGFSLSELEQACIVHLDHFCHQDLAT